MSNGYDDYYQVPSDDYYTGYSQRVAAQNAASDAYWNNPNRGKSSQRLGDQPFFIPNPGYDFQGRYVGQPGASQGYMQPSSYTSSLGQSLMSMGQQSGMQQGAMNPLAQLLGGSQIDPNMLSQLLYPIMQQMANLPIRKASTAQDIAAREDIAGKYGIAKAVQEPLTGVSEQLTKMMNDAMLSASGVASRSGMPISSMAENLRNVGMQNAMRTIMSQALQQGPQNLMRFGQWLTG